MLIRVKLGADLQTCNKWRRRRQTGCWWSCTQSTFVLEMAASLQRLPANCPKGSSCVQRLGRAGPALRKRWASVCNCCEGISWRGWGQPCRQRRTWTPTAAAEAAAATSNHPSCRRQNRYSPRRVPAAPTLAVQSDRLWQADLAGTMHG